MTDHHDEMRVSPDPSQAEDLRQRLHTRMAKGSQDVHARSDLDLDLDPAPLDAGEQGDTPPSEANHRRPLVVALAAVAVLALVVGAVALLRIDRDETAPITTDPPATNVPAATGPAPNGWVAFDSRAGDIYLVRPGEDARRLELAGSDTTHEACPTWSPDGTRLLFSRLPGPEDTTTADAELVIVPVGPDGAAGDPTVIALDGFDDLPCAIWAPDGRWVASGDPYGAGEVWVVDTQTGEIRRLPDLRPIDLEWRPGTDQLAIAGDLGRTRSSDWHSTPVSVYSVSTGELRQLGSFETGNLTWSPDGSTLAYQEDGLRLVDADGTNERLLVAETVGANHGIGPVWSPTGDRIAYQRLCCEAGEKHEVVLVRVADGNQTVIAPPQTDGSNRPVRWYPWTVTWSPDGTTLLYTAWSDAPGSTEQQGLLAIPADTPSDVTTLTDSLDPEHHQVVLIQNWGRQPG